MLVFVSGLGDSRFGIDFQVRTRVTPENESFTDVVHSFASVASHHERSKQLFVGREQTTGMRLHERSSLLH